MGGFLRPYSTIWYTATYDIGEVVIIPTPDSLYFLPVEKLSSILTACEIVYLRYFNNINDHTFHLITLVKKYILHICCKMYIFGYCKYFYIRIPSKAPLCYLNLH